MLINETIWSVMAAVIPVIVFTLYFIGLGVINLTSHSHHHHHQIKLHLADEQTLARAQGAIVVHLVIVEVKRVLV